MISDISDTDLSVKTPTPAEDLLEQLVRGDASTWKQLICRFRGLVRAQGVRSNLDFDEIQDLEQWVWVRLWRGAASIRDVRCLPAWISTTARREAQTMVRRRREVVVLDAETADRPDLTSAGATPPDVVIKREDEWTLHAALRALPPREARLMHALVVDELSYDEVSRRLNIPLGSIGPTRARAVTRLQRVLGA